MFSQHLADFIRMITVVRTIVKLKLSCYFRYFMLTMSGRMRHNIFTTGDFFLKRSFNIQEHSDSV